MPSLCRNVATCAAAGAGVLAACLLLAACKNLGYYGHTVRGQLELMDKRQPVESVIADPETPEALRERLVLSQEAREFASGTLKLPDNDSYRTYADLERPYAVWLVVATLEFAVEPHRWCFAFAGCFSYRGYFSEAAAEAFGNDLIAEGYDVHIAGGIAYSTLGWFDDPVLNTMLNRSDSAIVSLLFHELAHQQLYIKDDTAFNEAFAVAVEREGMRRWLENEHDAAEFSDYLANRERQDDFYALLAYYREQLSSLYASTRSNEEKQTCKAEVFTQLRASYETLKQQWDGYDGFDAWMAKDINNASLALVATYQGLVPGFRKLLASENSDFAAFYRKAEQLGELPRDERDRQLRGNAGNTITVTGCRFCQPPPCQTLRTG